MQGFLSDLCEITGKRVIRISILVNDPIEAYVNSLWKQEHSLLRELRQEAERGLVPIITRDTERLLYVLCRIHQPKRILEIGTAIGYSAICFSLAAPEAEITTIEVRERSFHRATENVEKAGAKERVRLLLGKAEEVLPELTEIYDLIFIDAAKGQYQTFFNLVKKNMKPGTLIISDNVLYKGMPADDQFIDQRRNKTIAKRMRDYLSFLSEAPWLETCLLPIGDGVALSYYLNSEN